MDDLNKKPALGTADIWSARRRIKPFVNRTPLLYSLTLSQRLNCSVYLKMECWQLCGCFKVRGAINAVSSLSDEQKKKGLVTASSGNHAIAVAYAASLFGNPATTIFLPENADASRVEKLRLLGAALELHGFTYLEAYDHAREFAEKTGAVYIHSHADPHIIAGQGTIGLEIIEDLPDVEAILVPIGGGGLISGIATAVKSASPSTLIYGVEPSAAPSAYMSFKGGVCYERIETKPSIADGLLGGIGRLPFDLMRTRVERVELVEDDEIAQAMAVLQQDEQLMVEAASCVGLAAVLSHKIDLQGKKIVFVITSRNIAASKYNQIIKQVGDLSNHGNYTERQTL